MTKTRDKLNEAIFFFRHMEEAQSGPDAWTQEGKDHFRYFFNAFASAARSVTYFMQVEFNRIVGFKEWYAEQQEKMKRDKMMKFFLKQRNIAIHCEDNDRILFFGRASQDIATRLILVDDSSATAPQNKVVSPADSIDLAKVLSNRAWIFAKFSKDIAPDNEVVSVSRMYLEKLKRLVDECEDRFLNLAALPE